MLGQCHNLKQILPRSVAQKIVVANHPVLARHWLNTVCAFRIPLFFNQQDILKGTFFIRLRDKKNENFLSFAFSIYLCYLHFNIAFIQIIVNLCFIPKSILCSTAISQTAMGPEDTSAYSWDKKSTYHVNVFMFPVKVLHFTKTDLK